MTAKLVSVATGLVPISYVKLNCGGKFDKHLNCSREGIHFIYWYPQYREVLQRGVVFSHNKIYKNSG